MKSPIVHTAGNGELGRTAKQGLAKGRAGWCHVSLKRAGIIWEEETSAEKMPPPDWALDKIMEHSLD